MAKKSKLTLDGQVLNNRKDRKRRINNWVQAPLDLAPGKREGSGDFGISWTKGGVRYLRNAFYKYSPYINSKVISVWGDWYRPKRKRVVKGVLK